MRTANHRLVSPSRLRPSARVPVAGPGGGILPALGSAFSVAKLAIADCPPLLVLTARFLLAGVVMLGAAALFGVPWQLSRRDAPASLRCSGSPTRPPIWASSYVGIAQHLVRPRGARHQRQPGADRRAGGGVPRRAR